MFKNETAILIKRPVDQVFDTLLDLSRWGAWHQGHIVAKQASPGLMGVGAKINEEFWLLPPIHGHAVYEVTCFVPGKNFEYIMLKSPVKGKVWHHLESVEGGTRLTLGTEMVPNLGLRIFERIFPNMGQRMLETEARKLKNLLEPM